MSPINAPHHRGAGAPPAKAVRTQSAPRRPRTGADRVSLVLVADPKRRALVAAAAEQAGWRVAACEAVAEALQVIERWRTELAIVELSSSGEPHRQTFRRFAEQLASRGAPLLIIADQRPSPADELWARQSGAWLYLPEMEPGAGVTELCAEALRNLSAPGVAKPVSS